MRIEFTIPGPPQGKARARVAKGHAYTPEKTRAYEDLVRLQAKTAINRAGEQMATGPVTMRIEAHIWIPASWSRSKRLAAYRDVAPCKPDIDNLIKCIADGCNGIMYADDKQIVSVTAMKYYSLEPCVIVEVIA